LEQPPVEHRSPRARPNAISFVMCVTVAGRKFISKRELKFRN
jgi:hypothetical protein